MTRIPHDSSELATWFTKAKQADHALAPSAQELSGLAARLVAVPAPASASALLSGTAAKVGLGVSAVVLSGGLVLGLNQAPPIEESLAPKSLTVSVPGGSAVPRVPPDSTPTHQEPEIHQAPGTEPTEGRDRPRVSAPSEPGARPRPSSPAPTWVDVNEALTNGNVSQARGGLERLIAREDGVAKEKAELALAELELRGPRAARAKTSVQRHAMSAREPSVRRRAQTLLDSLE